MAFVKTDHKGEAYIGTFDSEYFNSGWTLEAGGAVYDVTLPVKGSAIGEVIDQVEQFCKWYCSQFGGKIDYIHGDDETQYLSQMEGCCGMLLPQMEKSELCQSVSEIGPFPKKSFSIGLGTDKRYYLECRRIQ